MLIGNPCVPIGGIARIWPRVTLNWDTMGSNFRPRSNLSMLGRCAPPTIPVNFVPICRTTASQFNKIFSNDFKNLCRFAIYRSILFKLNYVVRIVNANDACKFHKDRLNHCVAVYYNIIIPRAWGLISAAALLLLSALHSMFSKPNHTVTRMHNRPLSLP